LKFMASGVRSALFIPILLVALALRIAPWGQNRFLEDEALYAYWGLQIATGADSMLDEEPVDKPPLYPYTLALSFTLTSAPLTEGIAREGQEMAARLPSLFASLAGISLVYALGRQLYGDARIGLMAAILLALSPFDVSFASTAFTDPLMTALALGALLAAASSRPGVAGLLSGLAISAKQQALFFLPLIVATGLISRSRFAGRPRTLRKSTACLRSLSSKQLWHEPWLRFGLGLAVVAAGIAWWDLARVQRPGFLEQSLISYGGLEPVPLASLANRAVEWLRLLGDFWASPWLNGLLLFALVGWFVGGRVGWCHGWSKTDLLLGAFVVAFLALHWLAGFQVWDRYLLGVIPLVALLTARAFMALWEVVHARLWRRFYPVGLGVTLIAVLATPVLQATHSELPLGGDHGAYDGIDELAAYLRAEAPPGSVLYHYWLGYHYRFYLYGAPLRLHWYPDLEDLAHDAYVYRREARYIAFPSWRDGTPVQAALAEAGIDLVPVLQTTRRDGTVSLRLYQLEGP
jgi:hypothetical protein